ncbi:MAG: hypothetical protein IJT38_05575 [Clostridia bacterium]|nr:hypothetical protein [Clostridia bacterium]
MSYTPNINLMLTPEDDTTTTFKAWRTGINGESNSNMTKIDTAIGDLDDNYERVNAKVSVISDKLFGESPKTWADVQSIVRNGAASQYFNIGDQFVVEKLSNATASKGTSTGISDVTVVAASFVEGMGETHAGTYVFVYDGKSWRNDNGKVVDLDDYGITVTGTPAVGDNVTITETTSQLKFDIIGIDHDTPTNSNYTHSMTLQLHDQWGTALVYDSPEAAFYIDEDTYPNGLVAGTYNFTWNYATGSMVNGTYQFTLTEAVPVGGQIVIGTNSSSTALTSCKIRTYATAGSTTAIESNIVITSGSDGTSLGTITSTGVTSSINCAQRIMWGSNNWKLSGIRQWLNTDSAANAWWEAKTVFDRPTNADKAGFLRNMDAAFLDIIGEVTKTTQKSVSDEYGLETTTEKFFLLSRPEVYAGTERSQDGADGKVYAYYGAGRPDLTAPGTGADTNRIKYRGGSAQYWWLRTPYSGCGNNVRYVNPAGYLRDYGASYSLGVVPACVIV